MSIMSIISQIEQSENTQEAIQIIEKLFEHNYTTIQLITNPHQILDNLFVRSTYPKTWIAEYLLNNYLKIDPIFNHITKTKEAVLWSDVPLTPESILLFDKAEKFGIGHSGYSFIHKDAVGIGSILSLNSNMEYNDWVSYIEVVKPTFEAVLPALHNKITKEFYSSSTKNPQLTSREKECLHYSSIGKSNSEVAMILSISEHTVRSYIKTIRYKLDCVTITQAVAKSIRLKII
ncbi:hypothetical protein BTO23_20845 [Aliivibrio sifiae]|uniref:HTH luxR-type domain-containing protein n=2 Tax=Aliivibrio sifiae TaxID=566293 RepID=A0A2S7X1G5_9GAMM|nr:hypothetical protein BTO23_20845 [Aliivibrio sifiae]